MLRNPIILGLAVAYLSGILSRQLGRWTLILGSTLTENSKSSPTPPAP